MIFILNTSNIHTHKNCAVKTTIRQIFIIPCSKLLVDTQTSSSANFKNLIRYINSIQSTEHQTAAQFAMTQVQWQSPIWVGLLKSLSSGDPNCCGTKRCTATVRLSNTNKLAMLYALMELRMLHCVPSQMRTI